MKVTLKIQHEGKVRQEEADLKGSTAGTILEAARRYLQPLNEGLPYEKRHHLLSVHPKSPLPIHTAGSHRAFDSLQVVGAREPIPHGLFAWGRVRP